MRKIVLELSIVLAFCLIFSYIQADMGDQTTLGWDYTNSKDTWRVNSSGHLVPGTNNNVDIGSSSLAIQDLYAVGNLIIGNGSPTVTQNGEDGYVEGTFEVDGAVRLDNASLTLKGIAYTVPSADGTSGQFLTTNGSGTLSWATGTGNTLDQSYDQGAAGAGRTINATDGAVNITSTDADAAFMLTIAPTPGSSAATGGIQITSGANCTQDALEFANSGSGNDIYGTAGTWTITKAGAATFAGAVSVGSLSSATTFYQAAIVSAASGNTNLTIDAVGAGTITLAGTSTGKITTDNLVETFGNVDIGDAATDTLTITSIIDGNVTLDDGSGASPSLILQDATDETATFSKVDAGFITLTTVAGDGLNILTGNLKVGNGTPGVAQDGEDAYVEGTLEVDGSIQLDGALTAASTLAVTAATTLNGAATLGDNIADVITVTGKVAGATPLSFDGNTANTVYTIFAITDPTTASKTVTFADATGTVMLSTLATNAPDIADSVTGGTNQLIFEGATANTNETVLTATDPTADRTITIPDNTGAIMLSSLLTNGPEIADSVTGGTSQLVFEGSAADASETVITVTNPTGDRTVTLADASGTVMLSTLATNAPDVADSVTGGTNQLIFEGATANNFETFITPTEPTADRTVTIPDASGTIAYIVKTVTNDTNGTTLTVAESGTIQTNSGASGAGVWVLPEASTAIGVSYTFVVVTAQQLNINPADATDTILGFGCAAGDSIQSNGAGDSITLVAIDNDNWVPIATSSAANNAEVWVDAN